MGCCCQTQVGLHSAVCSMSVSGSVVVVPLIYLTTGFSALSRRTRKSNGLLHKSMVPSQYEEDYYS